MSDNAGAAETEWVVVLDDPRPARLQGWQRSQYSGGTHYSSALELKRAGKRIASKYDLEVRADWFIESLNVYCLIALFRADEHATLQTIRDDKNVKWVQLSNDFELMQASNSEQIASSLLSPPELRLPPSINGKGVVIALVDSAIDDKHTDIKHAVEKNADFVVEKDKESDGEAHGTAIAGVIVADQQSELGVTGVASGAKLKSFRGCWETLNDSQKAANPNCSTLSLARALDAVAASQADILNLSLSGPKDPLLDMLISKIIANGTQVVTAFDPNRLANNRFPSAALGVLTVKATSLESEFSDTFLAPGTKVVAAPSQRADFMQGHSIASAYTTGVLALCRQLERQLNKQICDPQMLDQLQQNNIKNLDDLVSILQQEAKVMSP